MEQERLYVFWTFERIDRPLHVRAEIAFVSFLQIRQTPILARHFSATVWAAAFADEFIRIRHINHRVIKRHLFAGVDIAHRDERDLSFDA